MARYLFNVFWASVFILSPIYLMAYENEDINPIGRPLKYTAGKSRMCGIWHDEGLWNISVTSGKALKFIGSIKITGDKYIGRFEGLEKNLDKFGRPKGGFDYILPHKDGKGFDFVFNVGGTNFDSDTIQFKVGENATSIEFVITAGGDRDPNRIFIGKNSKSPSKIPFSLEAHPKPNMPGLPPKKATKASPKKI